MHRARGEPELIEVFDEIRPENTREVREDRVREDRVEVSVHLHEKPGYVVAT